MPFFAIFEFVSAQKSKSYKRDFNYLYWQTLQFWVLAN